MSKIFGMLSAMSVFEHEHFAIHELGHGKGPTEPEPLLWTRNAFYELMTLRGLDRMPIELIEGELVRMAAQSNLHAVLIEKACRVLRNCFGDEYWVRVEATLDLSDLSAPDPDVAVVRGSFESWEENRDNPTHAALVVEVSVTTASYDRRRKASMYAKNGIHDYWVIDALNKRLEIRRQPIVDASEQYGFGYAQLSPHYAGDVVHSLALPAASIQISDLLPR